jgi:hypothetical protein
MTLVSTQISTLVSNVGFPIAAFWLMYSMAERGIRKLNETVEKNTYALSELKILIKERVK